ncbi:MAG: sulfatase, partial [Planctomycetota bacterium]
MSRAAARARARIAAGFAWLALAACSGGERPRSILLVTLDTTRADRLGCYGRNGARTPVLDALAARGTRFARAYTTAPITLPAHASLLTGAPPPQHGLRDNGIRALDPRIVTLAEVARASGLRTGACVSGFPLDSLFGLEQGFESYSDEFGPAPGGGGTRMQERRGDQTVAVARAWLAGLAADEAFFLWVHLFDAHEPYQAPAEFAQRFPDDPYQAEIAYQDSVLAELFAALDSGGRSADTLVVVTADHGEGLGEHGEETHALLLYDTTMHVPLLLAGPDVPVDVCSEPVSLVDVAPTLVELAGLTDGEELARHGGMSLVPLLRGAALPPRELYLETLFPRLHFGWSELVGLVRADLKYVEAPGQERAELYRPAQDPREQADILAHDASQGPELARALDGLRRRLEANAFEGAHHAPSAGELETLAALGYGGVDAEAEIPRASGTSEPGRDPRQVIAAVSLLNAVRGLARIA